MLHIVHYILACTIFLSLTHGSKESSAWPRHRSLFILDYLNPFEDTSILKPRAFGEPCRPNLAWIFVLSATMNFKQRRIIRETWANSKVFNASGFQLMHRNMRLGYTKGNDPLTKVKVTFLVGTTPVQSIMHKLARENKKFGDILQEDFHDSYQNLTLKSMFLLKWASLHHCVKQYKFIVKADDDIFLNVPNMIQILRGGTIPDYELVWKSYAQTYGTIRTHHEPAPLTEEQRNSLILGELATISPPVRDPQSKYFVPDYMHPENFYPPYLNGALYIMSQSVTQQLLKASFNGTFMSMEDVYVTGILAEKISINPMHSDLWSVYRLGNICAQRGVVFENLEDASMVPDIMRQIFDANTQCEIFV